MGDVKHTPAEPVVFNAEIESAEIRFDRGFILTAWVFLKWSGSDQGYGGFALGGNPFDKTAKLAEHADQANFAADFIGGMMAVAGVDNWSRMAGRIVRVRKVDEWGDIIAIGHAVNDIWYDARERMIYLAKGEQSDG